MVWCRAALRTDRGGLIWALESITDQQRKCRAVRLHRQDLLQNDERYFPDCPERSSAEVNLDALRWMERISRSLESGYVFTIDYGYTAAESKRFPAGTLMSYRRHRSSEDILADPGTRDITAHVCFPALEGHGLETVRFETLARTLLDAGEADQFAAALAGPDETRRRLQLKTLLFGMGETFRTLLQRKGELQENKKAPIPRGLGMKLAPDP